MADKEENKKKGSPVFFIQVGKINSVNLLQAGNSITYNLYLRIDLIAPGKVHYASTSNIAEAKHFPNRAEAELFIQHNLTKMAGSKIVEYQVEKFT